MTHHYHDIIEISQRRITAELSSQKLAANSSHRAAKNMSSANLIDQADLNALVSSATGKMVSTARKEASMGSKASKVSTRSSSRESNAVASGSGASKNQPALNILSLNEDVFQEILSHLKYDEIAKARAVSRQFNEACQKALNKGFLAVQRYHNRCLKEMKAKLPRRESERRTHPLARHIDVLTGIETRLSLLSMTYYKYTVLGVFCFIPGKVLDECYRVLREVVVHKNPPKSYELLQELRDISSMAMEHFEEHIVPTMKRNQVLGNAIRGGNQPTPSRPFSRLLDDQDSDGAESSLLSLPSPASLATISGTPTAFIRAACNSTNIGSGVPTPSPSVKLELVVQQNRLLIHSQRKQIAELKSKLTDYGRKILEQDKLLNDYGRKLIQLEQKVSLSLQQSPAPQPSLAPVKLLEPTTSESTPKRKRKDVAGSGPSSAKRAKTTDTAGASTSSAFSMSLRSNRGKN